MRHFFYIFALLLLPLAAVAQSDSDEDDRYDTIQPSAVSWRVMMDAETSIG